MKHRYIPYIVALSVMVGCSDAIAHTDSVRVATLEQRLDAVQRDSGLHQRFAVMRGGTDRTVILTDQATGRSWLLCSTRGKQVTPPTSVDLNWCPMTFLGPENSATIAGNRP
jgi:hypothetical protein